MHSLSASPARGKSDFAVIADSFLHETRDSHLL